MIRRGTRADLPTILAIERSSFHLPHWSETDFLLCMEPEAGPLSRVVLVEEEKGVLRGMGVASALTALFPVEAEIQNLAVGDSYRRLGIGRALMHGLLDWAAEVRAHVVRLEVRISNEGATRLYRELGFVPIGKRQAYYRNPVEDAIVMEMFVGR